jgi:hypothetical protein
MGVEITVMQRLPGHCQISSSKDLEAVALVAMGRSQCSPGDEPSPPRYATLTQIGQYSASALPDCAANNELAASASALLLVPGSCSFTPIAGVLLLESIRDTDHPPKNGCQGCGLCYGDRPFRELPNVWRLPEGKRP